MVQNLKNFLIAFLTGLIVFGACALLILNAFFSDSSDSSDKGNKQVPGDAVVVENASGDSSVTLEENGFSENVVPSSDDIAE